MMQTSGNNKSNCLIISGNNNKIYKMKLWLRKCTKIILYTINIYEINILHCPTIYNKCSRNRKSRKQIDLKDYLTKRDFHSNVSSNQRNNCNKTIAGDKVSLESRIAISGLTS